MSFTTGGLFSGVGGFELGFEKAGFIAKWAVENDKYAAQTYKHNFKKHLLIEKDITSIPNKEIKNLDSIDILLAGFPCQAFSIAGYRKGFQDPRGNLFDQIIRFVENVKNKPKVLVLENVRNFYSHDDGKTWNYVKSALATNNYSQIPMILNTSTSTGIPQNRERAYIVCFKNEGHVTFAIQELHKKNMSQQKLDLDKKTKSSLFLNKFRSSVFQNKNALDKYLDQSVTDSQYFYTENKFNTRAATEGYIWDELNRSVKDSETVYQWRRTGEVRINKKGEVPTLTASMGAGGHNVPIILDGKKIRKLTPRECFNFQGFPKSFKLPKNIANNQLYKQAGNAVSVPLVKKIGKAVQYAITEKIWLYLGVSETVLLFF